MKIVIATDAWEPQTNGVVISLKKTVIQLQEKGHKVYVLNASNCRTVPLPTYSSIHLAIFPYRYIKHELNKIKPDVIHIATEGPIGWATRRYCLKHNFKFTTSYHTQFPQYVRLRLPIPINWTYQLMSFFHNKAIRTMVTTPSMEEELKPWINNLVRWTRGVNTNLFRPYNKDYFNATRPIYIFVGRIAIEKNIEAFLKINSPGTKYVVGDGPDLEILKTKYPNVNFTGIKKGKELAQHIAASDVFVFPSRTDTFGLVMLEAMACGVPVAAYPVTGPIDVVKDNITGALDDDLNKAMIRALTCDPQACRNYALSHTWEYATEQFLSNLEINGVVEDVRYTPKLVKP